MAVRISPRWVSGSGGTGIAADLILIIAIRSRQCSLGYQSEGIGPRGALQGVQRGMTSWRSRCGNAEESGPMSTIASPTGLAPRSKHQPDQSRWRESLAPFTRPVIARSLLDIATSVVPYLACSV